MMHAKQTQNAIYGKVNFPNPCQLRLLGLFVFYDNNNSSLHESTHTADQDLHHFQMEYIRFQQETG